MMRVFIVSCSVISALADQCDDVVLLQVSSQEKPGEHHFQFPLKSDGLKGELYTGKEDIFVTSPSFDIPLDVDVKPHEQPHEDPYEESYEEFGDEMQELDAIIETICDELKEQNFTTEETMPYEMDNSTVATVEELEMFMEEDPASFTEEEFTEVEHVLGEMLPGDKFSMLPPFEEDRCPRRNAWLHWECDDNWHCEETDTVVVGNEDYCQCEKKCDDLLPTDFKFCNWNEWTPNCDDEWKILQEAGYYECTYIECSYTWREHSYCGIDWSDWKEPEMMDHPIYPGAKHIDHNAGMEPTFCDPECEVDEQSWKKVDEEKIKLCKDTKPITEFWVCAEELDLPKTWKMNTTEKMEFLGPDADICEDSALGITTDDFDHVLKSSSHHHLKKMIANLASKSKNSARAFVKSQAPHLLN